MMYRVEAMLIFWMILGGFVAVFFLIARVADKQRQKRGYTNAISPDTMQKNILTAEKEAESTTRLDPP